MKRITIILLTIITVLTLLSCSNTILQNDIESNNTPSTTEKAVNNPACADIAASLIESFDINADEFDYYNHSQADKQLDEMVISLFYGDAESLDEPDFSHVTDYYLLVPITTAATEIGIFKVDDTANIDVMKQYFSNRAYARATTFAPYDEEESKKAQSVQIASHENYVWYIMTDSNFEIEAKILDIIK